MQRVACANIHHGSTADKTRVIEHFGPLVDPLASRPKRAQHLRASLDKWKYAKGKTYLEMRSMVESTQMAKATRNFGDVLTKIATEIATDEAFANGQL